MRLKPKSEEALKGWLGPRTWSSLHGCDWERWYAFVDAYSKEHGLHFNDADLIDHIVQTRAKAFGEDISKNENLLGVVRKHLSVAQYILDFLQLTKR